MWRNHKSRRGVLLLLAVILAASGCSQDVVEISEIALVEAVGIDYDAERQTYIFSSYCVMPSSLSTERSGKLSNWVLTGNGKTILEAAKSLRSYAGKQLIWQHNKFIVVGEAAARERFYEIMDFVTRNREIRLTSFLMISDDKALDKIKMRMESGELLSNELLGKVHNVKEWGKSVSQSIQDIANWNLDPYRGYVAGRIIAERQPEEKKETLSLKGGAVISSGKLTHWLDGDDAIVVNVLSSGKWRNLQFAHTVKLDSSQFTLFLNVREQQIHTAFRGRNPVIDVSLQFAGTIGELGQGLQTDRVDEIRRMEQATAKSLEETISKSITSFQHDLKIDILGFSTSLSQHHPHEWRAIQKDWKRVYSTMEVNVHAEVNLEKQGMTQYLRNELTDDE
ncbi:Ger(x)C family spore germination protein [Paenibacillus ferrarius]|uniref:Ger(x)C family spore germination protein n=1 Tax=Paenibacillus ferrarius TaxID=1469647 RepID=UPI003D2B2F65